jgi:hypothetical protein
MPTGRRAVEAVELHRITDAEARAFLERTLGPASAWYSPMIRYRFTSDFQEHWKTEVGHWLWTADQHGFLSRFLDRMLSRANQEKLAEAERKPDDALYTVLLQELAPAMAAHYLLSTGWGFLDFDIQPAPGTDIDLALSAPGRERKRVDIQVKAPSQPSFIDDRERHAIVLRRIDQAAAQPPRPANSSSLVVVCADRLWGIANDPAEVIVRLVGTSVGYGYGRSEVRPRGQFFKGPLDHIGGIMLLDYQAGISIAEERDVFRYSCTVLLNPRANPAARCDRSWFPRGRVLWLDSNTFRWDDDAPGGAPLGNPHLERMSRAGMRLFFAKPWPNATLCRRAWSLRPRKIPSWAR